LRESYFTGKNLPENQNDSNNNMGQCG